MRIYCLTVYILFWKNPAIFRFAFLQKTRFHPWKICKTVWRHPLVETSSPKTKNETLRTFHNESFVNTPGNSNSCFFLQEFPHALYSTTLDSPCPQLPLFFHLCLDSLFWNSSLLLVSLDGLVTLSNWPQFWAFLIKR